MEVDALWGLLAYFSAPKSIPEERYFVRWQVISKLFSVGVLAGDPDEMNSAELPPPSEPHLSACEKEIGFLTSLLFRGILDTLPSTDSVVTNLIRRALALQGDDYLGNEESRANCYPMLHDGKSEKKLVSRLWKATHPLFFMDADLVLSDSCSVFDVIFADKGVEEERLKLQHLLMPSSKVLRRCLALLPAWIRRVPGKKVRQSRLLKALNSLSASLIEEAIKAEEQISAASGLANESNSFETAFAAKSPIESGTGLERRSIFFREAAASLKIIGILSKETSGNNSEPSGPVTLSAEVANQVRDKNY
jgi:hypothetical protein